MQTITIKYVARLILTIGCFWSGLKSNNQESRAPAEQTTSLNAWIETAKQSVQKKVLANGMTVLFYPLLNTSQVYLNVIYNVGSRNEHEGQYGLAHMVEHMIFKGTERMSEVDLFMIAEKYGNVERNAFTSADQTSYYFVTDNKNWPIFLNILADCMQNVKFDENHFASEVKTVISELNLRRTNVIRKCLEVILASSFPIIHPYHHTTIGRREDLIQSTAQDLKQFYAHHYGPERATLIVVGNIDQATLFDNVEEYFGPIPTNRNPAPKAFDPSPFLPTDFVQHNVTIHTQTTNPTTLLYWVVPGLRDTTSLLTSCISYALNERLKKLKDSYDMVLSCHTSALHLFEAGIFYASYEPKTESWGKQLSTTSCDETCRILIENEIRDLAQNGPTDDELAKYKMLSRNNFVNGFENIDFVASILDAYCLNHNEYEAFDRFNYRQAITPALIKTFCSTHLAGNVTHCIKCVPLMEAEKKNWVAQQEKIERYEQGLLKQKERQSVLEEPKLLGQLPEPELLDFEYQKPDEQITLNNGLTVYVKQRSHCPGIVLSCGFKNHELNNAYYSQMQQSHIPSLAMKLLREESAGDVQHPEAYCKKEHDDFFDRLGAEYGFSDAGGVLCCLTDNFAPAVQRFFHILTSPTYPMQPLMRRVENIGQKIIQSQNDESHIASNRLSRYLFSGYSWIYSDDELLEQVKSYSQPQLVNFHHNNITPDNMFVIIVGNIEARQAAQTLEDACASWKTTSGQKLSMQVPELPNPPAQQMHFVLPKEQIILMAGRVSTYADTDDAIALYVLQTYLNRELFHIRERTGLFYNCTASLKPHSFLTKDACSLSTKLSPKDVTKAKQEINAVLQHIADYGVPAEYLAQAKMNYRLELCKGFSTNSELAESYKAIVSNNRSFSHYENKLNRINALTLDDINTVAKKIPHS